MAKRIMLASAFALLAACAPSVRPVPQDNDTLSSASGDRSSVQDSSGEVLDVTVEPFEVLVQPSLSTGALIDVSESRTADTLIIGENDEPLSIAIYLNPLSPYARDFQKLRMPVLIERFVRTGNLTIQLITLPIDKYDGEADVVRTTMCATDQGKGYATHERLYRDGVTSLDATTLSNLGVDIDAFDDCIATMSGDVLIPLTVKAAADGVTLVPTYVIRGKTFVGLPTQADLIGAINEAL